MNLPGRINFTAFTLLFILASHIIVFSQQSYNLKQFGTESENFLKQPFNWDAKDFGTFGLIAASTYLVMQADEPLRNEMLKDRSFYSSFPIEAARIWGEPYTTLLISGIFAISGISSDNDSNKRTAFEIIQSGIYTAGVTQIIKFGTGRSRPYTNEGSFTFHPFTKFSNDNWSLPSGHTSVAFSLSTIISKNSKSDFVKYVVYIPSLVTAFSRIYQDKHWLSDTFLGAAVGFFVAEWVHKQHDAKETLIEIQSEQVLIITLPL
ncbi:MAG: phosphatase PAP2 family protein [Ignavibacteriales bacterium]|nr:phosphatase PAP2 family protein [Ignavibacteriales bacterium]